MTQHFSKKKFLRIFYYVDIPWIICPSFPIAIVWLLFDDGCVSVAVLFPAAAAATFSGANDSWGIVMFDFWLFIVIILAGENEKIPAGGFWGDAAANIVCCPTDAPADKTEQKNRIYKMEKLEIWSKSVDPKGQSQKRAQIGHKKRSHQGQNQ